MNYKLCITVRKNILYWAVDKEGIGLHEGKSHVYLSPHTNSHRDRAIERKDCIGYIGGAYIGAMALPVV
jgi:hypothetical protein